MIYGITPGQALGWIGVAFATFALLTVAVVTIDTLIEQRRAKRLARENARLAQADARRAADQIREAAIAAMLATPRVLTPHVGTVVRATAGEPLTKGDLVTKKEKPPDA